MDGKIIDVAGDLEMENNELEEFLSNQGVNNELTYNFGDIYTIFCCS